jgi:hypothetical protein
VITIAELVVGDEPSAWAAAGFDVDGETAVVGAVRVRLTGHDARGRGLLSWALRDATLHDDDVDGLTSTRATDAVPSPSGAHPNGTNAIDHVVVATPDWPRTIAALGAAGFELRRERAAGTDAAPMRQGFFRAGEVIVEVVGPRDAAGDGPARFFGLALNVVDLDATKRFYGDRLTDPKPAVQPQRRIATLRHRDLGISTAIAFMST